MTSAAPTTIQGVSVLSEKERSHDEFDLVLSRQGIEVRRPEHPARQMSWDRVSEWEIEERKGFVLLTLRGAGATTPLVVPGWTLDDLELLMRDMTSDDSTREPNGSVPVGDVPATVAVAASAQKAAAPVPAETPDAPISAGQPERTTSAARRRRPAWMFPVTLVLLGVLATAVVVVLLQSAGIIDWSFLGPVA